MNAADTTEAEPAAISFPLLAAFAGEDPIGTETRDALDEIDRHRQLADQSLTYRDIETRMRDGRFKMRALGGLEGGSPAVKMLAAGILNAFYGDGKPPTNYQCLEWQITPAGGFDNVRVVAEFIANKGRSSHELRCELIRLADALVAAVESDDPDLIAAAVAGYQVHCATNPRPAFATDELAL